MAHLRSSMETLDGILFVPSKHDGVQLETLIHVPKAVTEGDITRGVCAAVIAHPWGLLGGSMYDHVVQAMFDVFTSAEFLVATYNSRGAGKSGGRGGAFASTDAADYESVLECVLSHARKVSVPVHKVYICGYSHGSLIASLVPPPIPNTSYLLISPLLPVIASFSTFFSSSTHNTILSKESKTKHSDAVDNILAIYGTGDIFALFPGRYRHFFQHAHGVWGDKFRSVEIEGGGHFWIDTQSRTRLLEDVEAFIKDEAT